jgi:hypothetical protein
MDESDNPITPIFSCMPSPGQYHLHTYAPTDNILYNIGPHCLLNAGRALGLSDEPWMSLMPLAAIHSHSLDLVE